MSKKINLLNNAEKEKLGEGFSVNARENPSSSNIPVARVSGINIPWTIGFALVIVFVIVVGVNLKLYLTIRGYSYEKNSVLAELNKIEKMLADNQSQLQLVSSVVKKVAAESEHQASRVSKLEKQSDAQTTAIQNLVRAKDALSGRISFLEAASNKSKK